MGSIPNLTINTYPRQNDSLNRRVRVCFHYDTSKTIDGTVLRDDIEEPFEMIIKLDDNRYIRSVECQYQKI